MGPEITDKFGFHHRGQYVEMKRVGLDIQYSAPEFLVTL